MRRLQEVGHALRLEHRLDSVANLLGEALLHLKTPREDGVVGGCMAASFSDLWLSDVRLLESMEALSTCARACGRQE